MSNKNKDKDSEWKLYTKAYELASRTGKIKTGAFGDPEQSGIIDNYYHLISTEGKLLARFSLDQMRGETIRNGCLKGCAVLFGGFGVLCLVALLTPPFIDIRPKARAAVASATLATIVKECAAKVADSGTGTYVVPFLNGYSGWTESVNGDGLTVGSVESCHISSGVYELTSSDTTQYPTWRYNVGTGEKTCVASGNALKRGCSKNGGEW